MGNKVISTSVSAGQSTSDHVSGEGGGASPRDRPGRSAALAAIEERPPNLAWRRGDQGLLAHIAESHVVTRIAKTGSQPTAPNAVRGVALVCGTDAGRRIVVTSLRPKRCSAGQAGSGPWQAASTLLPSGSRTNAA